MIDVTLCLTYFKSLSLVNLEASLLSVRTQDLSRIGDIVIVDNDTADDVEAIEALVERFDFPMPVRVVSIKHGDANKTHSWSTNAAVQRAVGKWVLFTRADYILDQEAIARFVDIAEFGFEGFITGHVYHLVDDVAQCRRSGWERLGSRMLRGLPGVQADYTNIDAGVWMLPKVMFDMVGGMEETLTAWGHAQTYFQYKLHVAGVGCQRIPEPMFYHPNHAAPRDIHEAHRQLQEHGISIHALWDRYEGAKPY